MIYKVTDGWVLGIQYCNTNPTTSVPRLHHAHFTLPFTPLPATLTGITEFDGCTSHLMFSVLLIYSCFEFTAILFSHLTNTMEAPTCFPFLLFYLPTFVSFLFSFPSPSSHAAFHIHWKCGFGYMVNGKELVVERDEREKRRERREGGDGGGERKGEEEGVQCVFILCSVFYPCLFYSSC